MFFSLFYYTVAFVLYIFLYEYYKRLDKKQAIQSDFLHNLDEIQACLKPMINRKPFDLLKNELLSNFRYVSMRIVFGIDLSASNEWQGLKTFSGQPLHKTNGTKIFNPYQKAISQLGSMFQDIFPSKVKYVCFGFGDKQSKDCSYFPIIGSGDEIDKYEKVLSAYLETTKNVALSGPTSFSPILKKLMTDGIRYRKDFTILIILTDELKFSHKDPTFVDSIRMLANLPNVCLLIVGIGDGPWQHMSLEEQRLRDSLVRKMKPKQVQKSFEGIHSPRFIYDNFHFVNFNSYSLKSEQISYNTDFARAVFTKLPTQLKQARRHEN